MRNLISNESALTPRWSHKTDTIRVIIQLIITTTHTGDLYVYWIEVYANALIGRTIENKWVVADRHGLSPDGAPFQSWG